MNTPPPSCGGYSVCWVSLNAATRASRLVDQTWTVVLSTAEAASRVPSGLNAMLLILLVKPVASAVAQPAYQLVDAGLARVPCP